MNAAAAGGAGASGGAVVGIGSVTDGVFDGGNDDGDQLEYYHPDCPNIDFKAFSEASAQQNASLMMSRYYVEGTSSAGGASNSNRNTNKTTTATAVTDKDEEAVGNSLNLPTFEFQKIEFFNGDTYMGQVRNGCREGTGVYLYNIEEALNQQAGGGGSANDDAKKAAELLQNMRLRYEGEWQANLKCGYGIMYFMNGDCYTGYWRNNTRNGCGVLLTTK